MFHSLKNKSCGILRQFAAISLLSAISLSASAEEFLFMDLSLDNSKIKNSVSYGDGMMSQTGYIWDLYDRNGGEYDFVTVGKGPLYSGWYWENTVSRADGSEFYPDLLLGMDKGGEFTIIFRGPNETLLDVAITKVELGGCTNRLKEQTLTVSANGNEQTLPYMAAEEAARQLLFEFPENEKVGSLTLKSHEHGLQLGDIRIYASDIVSGVSSVSVEKPGERRLLHIDGTPAAADDGGLLIEIDSDGAVRKILR